jgi:gluconokinase
MVIILMGVCGSGKTTIGQMLSQQSGWPFHDADGYHPAANVAKMSQAIPLTDDDRGPWVAAMAADVRKWIASGENAILGCSALSQWIRAALGEGDPRVRFVHLHGSPELLRQRMVDRKGHFMPAGLLDSQFAALQLPRGAVVVDVGPPRGEIVAEIRKRLGV